MSLAVPIASHERKLDAVRGVSSLAVVSAHAVGILFIRLVGKESPVNLVFANLARHAVLAFFLLSGYLITRSIVANIRRNGRFVVSDYLIARVARIYPPLIGAITLMLGLRWIIAHYDLPGHFEYGLPTDLYVARNAFFTGGWWEIESALKMREGFGIVNSSLWSLYIEFRLYIVAMFIAMAWVAAGVKRLAWSVLAAWFAVTSYHMHEGFPVGLCAAVWGIGAGAVLWPELGKRIAMGACVALLAAVIMTPESFDVHAPDHARAQLVQVAFAVLYAFALFRRPEGANPPRWMVASADYSYSLYVIHFPLLLFALSLSQNWMGQSMGRTLAVVAAAIAGCVFVAYWFALLFENQRLFKRAIRFPLDLARTSLARFQAR